MKKLNIVILLSSFLLILMPYKANALTSLGKSEGYFEKINNEMYSHFAGDSYFKFYKVMYYVKWLKENNKPQIAYCVSVNTSFADNSTYTDNGAIDVGIQYIIKNGFTGTEHANQTYHYSTNDTCSNLYCPSLVDLKTNYPKANTPWYDNYWLTQIAIWVYQGENNTAINELKTILNGSNLTENQKIVKNLVDGANAVKNSSVNFATLDPKMTISSQDLELNEDYFYSKIIETSGTGDTFSVSVSNNDYEIVDSSKNPKSSFNKGESFYIRIAKSKVAQNGDVTVTLSTQGDTYANKYVSESGVQSLAKYVVAKSDPKTATLTLNVTKPITNCDLTIKVVDSKTKEKICGGKLTVYDENGNVAKNENGEVVGNIELSNEMCEVKLSLPKGKYKVVQDTTVDPYIKDNEEHEVNTETTCPVTIEIPNDKQPCDLTVKVIDADTKEKICGGKLTVYDEEGNVAKNENGAVVGNIELSKEMCEVKLTLPRGKYKVVQNTTIDPYIKDNKEYEVNTETTCPVTIEIPNGVKPDTNCDLTIKVVDSETKEKICGGKLTVYDEEGNVAKNENGEVVGNIELSNEMCEVKLTLPKGKYKVVQNTTIDPYIKDNAEHEVNTETVCPVTIEIPNEKLYQIRILKINGSEDNPLSGAKLKLTSNEGTVIKEFISSTEPVIINQLSKGIYYLSEVKAPSGYALSNEIVTIEVNDENNNKIIYFDNDEIIVPSTGNYSNLLIMSLLIGGFGVFIIYYSQKEMKNNKQEF